MDIKVSYTQIPESLPVRYILWPVLMLLGIVLTLGWMCLLGYGLFEAVRYLVLAAIA